MATFVKGGAVGRKRLLFRRGDVLLVIDFEAFEGITQGHLKEQGGDLPEEVDLLKRLSLAMKSQDEASADLLVKTRPEQTWLDLRLAEVLDRGAFQIRDVFPRSSKTAATVRPAPDLILRLDYSYECGDLCGTGGRVFLTDACQQLVAVTDWVR